MPAPLSDLLLDPERRDDWVDCMTEVIEQEVGRYRGLKGVTIRSAYAALSRAKPGVVRHALRTCWEDWVAVFEPLCVDVPRGGLADVFVSHEEVLVGGLLDVVDRRVAKSDAPLVETLYQSLRGGAGAHVGRALPSIAEAIETRRGDR